MAGMVKPASATKPLIGRGRPAAANGGVSARGRKKTTAPAAPPPAARSREFAQGAFPPDRYLLVEARLGECLADWIVAKRSGDKPTGDKPTPYAQMAHLLMNATGMNITNEAVRRWAQHLADNPDAVRSYTDFPAAA